MKKTFVQRFMVSALALAALAILGSPGSASANTTADSTVLNVVRVDYKDASGTNSFAATASSTITVNLVKAALNNSAPPTGANGSPALSCLPAGDYLSGSTISSLYALAATANGDDNYNLSIVSTPSNANNVTVAYSTRTYTGAQDTLNPAARRLGSAIPVAISGTDTLIFPGGSLADFAANDIVLVEIGGAKKAFLVDTVVVGQKPIYSNGSDTPQTTVGSYTQAEVQGSLKLKAYADQTVTLNGSSVTFGGGNTAPAFSTGGSIPTLGVPVGEMVLVQIDVTASATSITTDGTVAYTLTATNGTQATTIACTAGNFKATTLSITKEVRNITAGTGFGATSSGNPADILEYRVTVTNTGGQAAQVVVTDPVPDYTKLVTFPATYGTGTGTGAGTDIFAKISDGTNSVDLTVAADSETQPLAPVETGFGKAAGITAGSVTTIYVGDTATNALGGKVPTCSNGTSPTQAACTAASATWITSYTILYQVKID
jgi:uncharacterized repeat protein (TIGR01451 family)